MINPFGKKTVVKNTIRIILSLNLIFWQTFILSFSIYRINIPGSSLNEKAITCLLSQPDLNAIAVTKISNNESVDSNIKYCSDSSYQKSEQDAVKNAKYEVYGRTDFCTGLKHFFQSSFSLRSPPHNLPV